MYGKMLLGTLLASPMIALAAEADPSVWQFGGGFGLTMGGDELGTIHIYDSKGGKRIQSENIRTGRLFQYDLGIRWRPQTSPLQLQLTLGYHHDTINGKDLETNTKDVSSYFGRYPLEFLPAWRFDRHSVGLGLRYDFSPTLASSGQQSYKFKHAPGGILEYGYSPGQHVTFGLRLVKIKYKLRDDPGETAEGDHIGVNTKFWF